YCCIQFFKVQNGELIIKCYYFPFAVDKRVPVKDLRKLKFARQSQSYEKNWGSNWSVWWACDMKRNFRKHSENYYNMVVDNGDCFEKGFTVKDIVGFQRALRNDLYDFVIKPLV
ncbi:unnamed protein product, partial [Haemonchus placei]|uniref:MATH domain-containing protein n=1 Tax=Haemonchus placei TaxID=6290 RepID=A0A0N4W536_HAEPC